MTKMERVLCLYTQKLFPQFSTPAFSRFSALFSELSEKDFEIYLLTNTINEELENFALTLICFFRMIKVIIKM